MEGYFVHSRGPNMSCPFALRIAVLIIADQDEERKMRLERPNVQTLKALMTDGKFEYDDGWKV